MAKIRLRSQQAVKMRRKHGCAPKHDLEKWEPVSRLREAWQQFALSFDASAGEGRSEEYAQKKQDDDAAKSHRALAPPASAASAISEKI
jgi:hypothetical protein